MKNEIDQTLDRIADLDTAESNDILYEENSNGANYGMCDHYSFCTVADLKALALAYTQLKADLATAIQGLESAQDCLCNACGTSYRIIEETLDKIGKE